MIKLAKQVGEALSRCLKVIREWACWECEVHYCVRPSQALLGSCRNTKVFWNREDGKTHKEHTCPPSQMHCCRIFTRWTQPWRATEHRLKLYLDSNDFRWLLLFLPAIEICKCRTCMLSKFYCWINDSVHKILSRNLCGPKILQSHHHLMYLAESLPQTRMSSLMAFTHRTPSTWHLIMKICKIA